MRKVIVGISAFYHDSAAAIVIDGKIIAAAQEERFSRKKQDESFPTQALTFVMNEAGVSAKDVTAIVFYDKPYLKFERLLETYHAFVPQGLQSFLVAIPVWIKEKLFMKRMLRGHLKELGFEKIKIFFSEHHLSHAASAFYPSPYTEAAILTIDGVGEYATTTIGYASNNRITILEQVDFPHSVGLLYSSFTYYLGFKVNSGEYKLMGLAPYGNAGSKQVENFITLIKNKLLDIKTDGSISMNMNYFAYATGLKMCNVLRWEKLFGFPPRKDSDPIKQEHMDLALAIQKVTEEIVIKLAIHAKELTGSDYLVMAGGVALNSVANTKVVERNIFKDIWVQPAAGDAGGSLGAALAYHYIYLGLERQIETPDAMSGSYLGPSYTLDQIIKWADSWNANYEIQESSENLTSYVGKLIAEGAIVGWFQGKMEFGPRALGNRSILADPRNKVMQRKLNLNIKYREGFRPFAPSVLEEDNQLYFEGNILSPYMLQVVPVKNSRRVQLPIGYDEFALNDKLYFQRSDIPSVTHIDYTSRTQTVSKFTNTLFHQLISEFKKITGYGLLINTSFNVRGEPIVCSPLDAYRCFMNTEMDYLVIDRLVFDKKKQPVENKLLFKILFEKD